MPYFYLKKGPNLYAYRGRPRQEHSGAKNHYKKRAKQGPGTEARFLIAGPEPTGNPSKNPKKHHKKPLPPRRQAGGREEGWAGWVGWAGWAGWAGLGWLG